MFNIDIAPQEQKDQVASLSKETEDLLKKYSKLPADSEYYGRHWKHYVKAGYQKKPRRQPTKLSDSQLLEIKALYLRNLNYRNLEIDGNYTIQLGTVIEGPTEYYNRLTKRYRSKNIVDEIFLKDYEMRERVERQRGEIARYENKMMIAKRKIQSSLKKGGRK